MYVKDVKNGIKVYNEKQYPIIRDTGYLPEIHIES